MYPVLMNDLRKKGVHFVENATVIKAITEKDRCVALVTAHAGKKREYRAPSFIIATGGLFSEGIHTSPGKAEEAIFTLPIPAPAIQDDWSCSDFFGGHAHTFASMGVAVNHRLNPVGQDGAALWTNVYFTGRSLGGYDFASEKSGSGVALASGHFAGQQV